MSRLPCLIPFCEATRGLRKGETRLPSEWICARHWRLVSGEAKSAYRGAWRLYHRLRRRHPAYADFWRFKPGSPRRFAAIRIGKKLDAAWDRCKAEAIEKAMGI